MIENMSNTNCAVNKYMYTGTNPGLQNTGAHIVGQNLYHPNTHVVFYLKICLRNFKSNC